MLIQEDKINVFLIKKKHDWKEDNTAIPQEPRQKKVKLETEKGKQIITKYPNEQHHWTKRANLCWSKINLCSPNEPVKNETWMRN